MQCINKTRFFILTVILTLLFSIMVSYAKYISNDLSDSVVRLHIVANSDSAADQQLKLLVRDRIIAETNDIFDITASPSDALVCAKNSISYISAIAEDEIKKHGFNYKTNVTVGKFSFPTKAYNDITLPAGKYNAVRVEIGEANGKNWWCVMYPPLCFTDGVLSASPESRKKLQASLTEGEYNLITGKDSGTIPVEIRFKIVEIFQKFFN